MAVGEEGQEVAGRWGRVEDRAGGGSFAHVRVVALAPLAGSSMHL